MFAIVKMLLVFVILAFACGASSQSETPKGKLFIIGGGDKPPEMIARIIDESDLGDNDYALILPMSGTEPDSSVYYAKKLFNEAGLHRIAGLNCTIESAHSATKADSIRKAKLIFITGGDQSRFMDIVAGSAVEKAIQAAYITGALIAGTSAGAALMSSVMITGNQLKFPEYTSTFSVIEDGNIELRQGLGLLPNVIFDQHFVIRSRHNRLITALLLNPDRVGIGIDEATAILVHNRHAEVIGASQVFVYAVSSKRIRKDNGKLGAEKIRLDIYLPGDSFSVK